MKKLESKGKVTVCAGLCSKTQRKNESEGEKQRKCVVLWKTV